MKKGLFILLLCCCSIGLSQEATEEDLKVGLVLSGGGAKGLAHIGALKVIEASGVRIDYIGGTSMGAIVGALYASGYTAPQLDSIFNALDFSRLIQDEIPRSAMTFYEKEASEKYALALPFDQFKLGFPSGLSKGQNVYNLLSNLTAHVDDIDDFSKLSIPFFCIATDVENGTQIMLENGYLPRAITASGALPSVFSPVVINDVMMIDGGVVNNYPVDELRAKGMDIIIGVDVQDSLKTRADLKSGFDVLVQLNNFHTIKDMVVKKEKTDVYLNPNIEEFTVISFDEGQKIIDAGETEAKKAISSLKAIADKQKEIPKATILFKKRKTLHIKTVEISGLNQYSRSYVLGKLKLQVPDKISYDKFNEGINNLSATGNFQDIDYRIEDLPDGDSKVHFILRESDSKVQLRIGAHYDDLYRTGVLLNVTRKRLFTNNDIASFDFIVGDNLRYDFNYYIDKGFYWSVGLNSQFNFFNKDVPTSFIISESVSEENIQLNRIDLEYGDLTNQWYFETLFQRSFLVGLGLEHKWLRYLSETLGIDENENLRTVFENTNYFSTYGYLVFDTLDNSFFPNSGLYFSGDFHLYLFANGANKDFDQFSIAKAKAAYATSFTDNVSMLFTTEGGFKIAGSNTNSLDFFAGGYGFKELNNIVPLYGYEALSLRGNTYLKSTITIDYEFITNNHFTLAGNISNIGDDLFETVQWIDRINYRGIALGYGLETFLGPIELKYSYSPERSVGEWYVSAGFRF
jgi:NTE family protein